ncbi:MAG: hypothetical protein IT375_28795 [Polyangiaceae bacterium]|nr:hypothetical protein [Polyangiaceae bacterium]
MRRAFLFAIGAALSGGCGGDDSRTASATGAASDAGDAADGPDCSAMVPDTLPTGPCATGAGPCPVLVPAQCPDGGPKQPGKYYECSCVASAWSCELHGQELSYCDDSFP